MAGRGSWRLRSTALAAIFALAGCSGGGTTPTTPTPSPSPAPAPVAITAYDTSKCYDQPIAGAPAGANTFRKLFFPDTLKIDLKQPAVFPNGRHPRDPVADVLLAILLLDLSETGQSTLTFADLPLNPGDNDRVLPNDFPFLAPPQGSPPMPDTTGTSFDFRVDPDSAYVRLDRMGQPAYGPVLIPAARRNPFNDADPVDDNAGRFAGDVETALHALFVGIGDDLTKLDLKICAVPK